MRLQRKAAIGEVAIRQQPSVRPSVDDALRTPRSPLDAATRNFMVRAPGRPLDPITRTVFEPRFGHDFRDVRVHTDARAGDSAKAVDALAYTAGPNIVLPADAYKPASAEGRELLAHELTHVVRQSLPPSGGEASELAAETEANRNAIMSERNNPLAVTNAARGGAIQRQAAGANLLQRKCACGGLSGPTGECQSCRRKKLQSRLGNRPNPPSDSLSSEVPQIVHEVLSSSGRPLDRETRVSMEPHFGHDFSRVRVHTDAKATESARAVNALAYAVGQDMVFDTGRYAPETDVGIRLLAHELTHVVQQSRGARALQKRPPELENDPLEREAEEMGSSFGRRHSGGTMSYREARETLPPPAVQSTGAGANALDQRARNIIAIAADQGRSLQDRATAIVREIINTYFSGDASKISSIAFNEPTSGLSTTYRGQGQAITGIITVGAQFVNGTDARNFGRRVLQVGHEIEHVNQQRSGMGGANRSHEREFLAFYREALAIEHPGTGRMQHATRVSLIDAALGHYYCLDRTLQERFAAQRQELITRRSTEVTQSGRQVAAAPSSCVP
jgi:hypothetical protein